MYRWSPASYLLLPLPSAYLLLRRPGFISATLNYAATLSPQLWGTWYQSSQGQAIGFMAYFQSKTEACAKRPWFVHNTVELVCANKHKQAAHVLQDR